MKIIIKLYFKIKENNLYRLNQNTNSYFQQNIPNSMLQTQTHHFCSIPQIPTNNMRYQNYNPNIYLRNNFESLNNFHNNQCCCNCVNNMANQNNAYQLTTTVPIIRNPSNLVIPFSQYNNINHQNNNQFFYNNTFNNNFAMQNVKTENMVGTPFIKKELMKQENNGFFVKMEYFNH